MRWAAYTQRLKEEGFIVELWTIDSINQKNRVPRLCHPFFPVTLLDQPSVSMTANLHTRLIRAPPQCVVRIPQNADLRDPILERLCFR